MISPSILAVSVFLRCFFKDFIIEQPLSPAYGSFIICFLELLSPEVFVSLVTITPCYLLNILSTSLKTWVMNQCG